MPEITLFYIINKRPMQVNSQTPISLTIIFKIELFGGDFFFIKFCHI